MDARLNAGHGEWTSERFEHCHMKITAAVVPVRSAPFEIDALDLAAPLADEVLVRVGRGGGRPSRHDPKVDMAETVLDKQPTRSSWSSI